MTGFLFGGGGTSSVTATGSVTSRLLADRFAEVYNIKDFGAIGDGASHKVNERYATLGAAQAVWACVTNIATDEIDWAATQTAATTMFASTYGGKIYAPPGNYAFGNKRLDLISPGSSKGSFEGDGPYTATFSGTFNDGFLIEAPYQVGSVTKISGLRIVNFSTNIGTGALRYVQGNEPGLLTNLSLEGMSGLDAGWNVFNLTAIGVTAKGAGQTISAYGSVGMILSGTNLFGHRNSGAAHEIAVTMVGSQSMIVSGISVEETPVGVVLGLYIGMGTATITGANGSKKLTVTGTLYPPAVSTATPLQAGDQIVTSGVNPLSNPSISVVSQDSGTPNEQGVYTLSGADNVTISTPQPIQIRRRWIVSSFSLSGLETEGDGVAVYVLNASGGVISGINATGQINQGNTNEYGGNVTNSGNVSSPMAGIYIETASGLKIEGASFSANTTKAAVQFAPNNTSLNNLTIDSVRSNVGTASTSDASAFIDNGAGTTLVTNATTSSSSAVLHFAAGTIPGSVVAGVPVYSVTTPGNLPIYSRVSSVNNGAGTVTLAANTNGVANGETIKFCVPSGVAGNVLTVQTITNTLGRGTTCFPATLFTTAPQGGFAVQGSGVSTGADTPMISDQVNGYGPNNGGQSYAQYTLIKADGSAVSLNLGARVFTFVGGKRYGISNLTGLSGITGNTKAGIQITNSDNDSTIDMVFADLPGQSGVSTSVLSDMVYTITDAATGNCADGACNWGTNVTGGGGSLRRQVRYNGTNWTVVGK